MHGVETLIELEKLDACNLPEALATYKTDPGQFKLHVLNTIHPNAWNLRTFPPFRKAFPEHAKEFDEKLETSAAMPEWIETGGDSVLTRYESLLLASPPLTKQECNKQKSLKQRIVANPKYQDMKLLLKACYGNSHLTGYTPQAHEHMLRLVDLVTGLANGVERKDYEAKMTPVRAIGTALCTIGGLQAQRAVAAAVGLVMSEN